MPPVEVMPNRFSPILVPLLVVLVVLLAAGGFLLMNKQQELDHTKMARNKALQQVADRDLRIQELEAQLEENNKERTALEERLSTLRTQLAETSKDIEHSREVLQDMQGRYETVTKERDQLQTQLVSVTNERGTIRKEHVVLEDNKKDLERSASRLRERLALLDRDYQKLSQQLDQVRATPAPSLSVIGASGPASAGASSAAQNDFAPAAPIPQAIVELPPILVRKDQAGMAVPVRGRVLDVNDQHNFLVVDKGSVDGVRVGMVFDIVRGANTVGRASVVRVRPQLSACDIVRTKTPGPVQSGDVAVQSSP